MKISYTILAYNEVKELRRLLNQLVRFTSSDDEILVLLDSSKEIDKKMYHLIDGFKSAVKVYERPLNNDFASQKNHIAKHATGDYIINVDADEYFHTAFLDDIHTILSDNDIDVIRVPRINIVRGMTEKDIKNYRWKVNDKGWINFYDPQWRIYKNKPEIYWKNKVHEVLTGYITIATLPAKEEYCLYHIKDIKKQRKQNQFYAEIYKNKI